MLRVIHTKKVTGRSIQLPGSKSESNRLLLLNALSGNHSQLHNLSEARDTRVMSAALQKLSERSGGLKEIDCLDAGSVLRFMMAACCLNPGSYLLKGSERLMARPMKGLIDALRSLGASIEPQGLGDQGPWKVSGGHLHGNWVEVDGSESSQFVSAMLLIAPFMGARLSVHIKGAGGSWPYIEMTLKSLRDFGVDHRTDEHIVTIEPGCTPPKEKWVEADWSSAAFVYPGMFHTKAPVELPGLQLPSSQGDSFLSSLFPYYGIHTTQKMNGVLLEPFTPGWQTRPATLDLSAYPDLTPALVVNAMLHGQDLDLRGLESLAGKESQRDEVLGEMVKACGHEWTQEQGLWCLRMKDWKKPGTLQTHNDHRMAMAFALLAIKYGEITLSEGESVEKSFPGFWTEMAQLGFERS